MPFPASKDGYLAGQTASPSNFTIVNAPPDTWITSATVEQGGWLRTNSVTINWAGSDITTSAGSLQFSYKLDGGSWSTYSGSKSVELGSLGEGPHSFYVRSYDGVDADPTPEERQFKVDTISPYFDVTPVVNLNQVANGNLITVTIDLNEAVSPTISLTELDSGFSANAVTIQEINSTSHIYRLSYTITQNNWRPDGVFILPIIVQDQAGNSGSNYGISIRLENNNPTIISKSPDTGDTVDQSVSMYVTFSEAMNRTSTENALSIQPQINGSFSWTGNTLTFIPSASMPCGTNFTLQVNSSAVDQVGKSLTAASWSFATQKCGIPEVDVQGKGVSIVSGDTIPSTTDDTEFGSTAVTGGTLEHTFTILNTGNADLNLTSTPKVVVSGTNVADFTVNPQPTSPVTAGNSTTFTVTFDPSAAGLRTATLTIANNDSDEGTYSFTIQGTGLSSPTATTNAATSITTTGATLNGTVNANNASTTVTFQYGLTTSYGSTATATQSPVSGTANTAVSASITGLTSNTLYHFRVVAVNTNGTANGSDLTFTTSPAPPTATTNAASGITTTGAMLNGTVNANNDSTAVTFQYGLTTIYGSTATATQSPVSGTSNTAVSASITGLTPNTLYHFRVVAVNSGGTTNGSDLTFTTSAAAPTATTNAATGITTTGATLNGTVNANNASTTVTFQYGLTTSYGSTASATQSPVSGTSNTSVSASITGLTPNTLYHFRVVAVNTGGTTNGSDLTFTTTAVGGPSATTNAASGVTTTGATLNGTVNANNASTTVTFQYGLTTSYGSTASATQSPVSGTSNTSVSASITGLTSNTFYHFRVVAVNTGGTTNGSDLTFKTNISGKATLLVDDDDNVPDVRSYYTDALISLGKTYVVWDTANSDKEPDVTSLAGYGVVIWFTGDEFLHGVVGPGTAGATALGSWLDGGGCFLLSSQDYYYVRGKTTFASSYLGLDNASEAVQGTVTGVGSVFSGLGPYTLSYPFSNFSDLIRPDATAETAFNGNIGSAAVYKDSGVYRTAYLGFPIEAIATPSERAKVIDTFLNWCSSAVAVPAAPTGVNASKGTYAEKVQVSWTSSTGATSYQVYRNTSNSSSGASLLGSPSASPYDDTSATAGTTYWYFIKACNTAGCSGFSSSDSGYRAILAPTGVSASDGTYTDKVQVSWNASSGATYYEVYRNTSNSSSGASPLGSPSASPYDDMSGTAGTTYWYFIKACNTAGCSGFSSSDSGYRNQGPLTPSNFRMINTTQTSITIGWDNVSDENGYKIYKWSYSNNVWDFYYLTSVGIDLTSYTEVNLPKDSGNHFYKVSAYNSFGEFARTAWIGGGCFSTGTCSVIAGPLTPNANPNSLDNPPSIPSLLVPNNKTLTTNYRPHLDWSDSKDSERHYLPEIRTPTVER